MNTSTIEKGRPDVTAAVCRADRGSPPPAAPATHTVNGACTFEAPSPFTVPDHYANNPQYNGLDASCKAWFFAGDTIFDVQADGPTAAFCGCCNACDPTGHGHGYGVCAQC